MNKGQMDRFIAWVLGGLVVLGVLYFFPWGDITWGRVVMKDERTITVSGYAESEEKNQIANFSAGVTVVNDDKDKAVSEVNKKMEALLKAVKDLGIAESDIQTQSINVYQNQEIVREGGSRTKPGQWNASNTISIILRDVDKAGALTDVLTQSGATNIYGPNFQLDTSKKAGDDLLAAAVADSRAKADMMAAASGAKVGGVVSIFEGGQSSVYPVPMMAREAKDVMSAPVEVGSTKITKSVTVVWSLR